MHPSMPPRTFFGVSILFLVLYFVVYNHNTRSPTFQSAPAVFTQSSDEYLIDTETCHLKDWPLFDSETKQLYTNLSGKDFGCDKNKPPFAVTRVNFTWLHIAADDSWSCFAQEIIRTSNDGHRFGPQIGPLGQLTNLANNLTELKKKKKFSSRWDAVLVKCTNSQTGQQYSRVVPLVQHYRAQKDSGAAVNVLLLGIDSVSRLNFLRHMTRTKQFFDENNFIALHGYHKVGENSFPNILPMYTGHLPAHYLNDSTASTFKFDNVPIVFKNFQRHGYLTTFIEDMPPYGFFSPQRGGFVRQPTDYYLRPTNLAIWPELYYTYSCYQDKLEHEIYWQYVLDQLEAFRVRGQQSYFTHVHMSTLTHNYMNHAGYVDKPFETFLHQLFAAGHQSTVIVYSDHALRFGPVVNTTVSVHESRLPFISIYLPDSLSLDGLNASQLREIVRANQNRLTSHLDVHATLLHLLGDAEQGQGRSLLAPIPLNRTCASAGIPAQYCLCNSYEPIQLTDEVLVSAQQVVGHMNQMLVSHGNYCVPLTLDRTYRAFESVDGLRILHFHTTPNDAIFETVHRVAEPGDFSSKVVSVSRLTRYGDESSCVADKLDIVSFCYCWSMLTPKT